MTPDDLVPRCLTDPRDRILLSQAPILPMPRFGTLPDLAVGRHQYVAASDGLYVRAHHHGVSVTARLRKASLPAGPLTPRIHLPGGLIPATLYVDMQRAAIEACPLEWAGFVHWNEAERTYQLTVPQVRRRSCGDIQYETDALDFERVVLIVHSHGVLPDFFSATDNESDGAGVYFASVLGECQDARSITSRTRLVIEGKWFPLKRPPWLRPGESAACIAQDEVSLARQMFEE